ncbi:MAG TPA: hypothetical protein VFZ25_08615 [Chloroflexota bacterium]|nr:hypothetical protein [Chloroflexota bacterium]
MFAQRVKVIAAAGILCGALGAAAVAGAFAAPAPAADPTPTATAQSQTATPTNAQPATQSSTGQATNGAKPENDRGERGFGPGTAMGQPLATFLGISVQDLRTAVTGGQTLAQIAQAHGKTTDQLKSFLTDQEKTRLDSAVKNGKLTSDQETKALANFSGRLDNLINQKFQAPPPRGPRGGFFDESGIAQFLGISATDLRTALQNGQTLAQVAQAHGKSAADLKNYLLSQDSQRIDKLLNQTFQFGKHAGKPAPNVATPQATPTSTGQ